MARWRVTLIGQFPHERIPNDKVSLYIHPDNHAEIRQPGSDGLLRHWILEIHFVDRKREIGAFVEELLTELASTLRPEGDFRSLMLKQSRH